MPRCDLCFKEKSPLQAPLPKVPSLVCKGCFYEIDRIIGYLLHYGCQIMTQGQLAVKPPKPPKSLKSKSEGDKKGFNSKPPMS